MTSPVDIDPYAALRAAGVLVEVVPEITYTPDSTQGSPHPAPVTIPARVQMQPDLARLPDELKSPDGSRLDLAAAIAVLWQTFHSLQLRSVVGRTLVPPGTYGSGDEIEILVSWDDPPLLAPTAEGPVSVSVGSVAWMGDVRAKIKPGSLSAIGCTVVVTFLGPVVVATAKTTRVVLEATAQYLYTPPLTSS